MSVVITLRNGDDFYEARYYGPVTSDEMLPYVRELLHVYAAILKPSGSLVISWSC